MGVITRAFTFTGTPTEAQWNVDIDAIISEITGQLDSANCDTTSSDAIMTLDVAQTKTARQTFSGGVILDELLSTANAGSGHVKIADIRWDAGGGSLADNDGLYLAFTGDDSGAAETEYMRLALNFDDVTATNEDASLVTSLMKAGTLTSITTLTNVALSPTTTDAVSLGTSSLNWSDLFLDSGAVINFDSGNVTLTHSSSTLTVSGNLSVGGNFDVTGTLDFSDSAITNAGDIQLDSITGDGDTDTSITFSGSNVITVKAANANQVTFTDGGIIPSADNDIDLGSGSYEFKDAYFDGTVTTDGLTVSSTTNLDGAIQVDNTITVGVDDTGHDVKFFGASAGAYLLYDESADTLDVRGATAAGAGKLKLTTGELTVVDGDILGRIDFQAPLEASGTDAVLVGASIWAEADDTFGTALNDTDLVFAVAESETAAERMRLSYDGTNVALAFTGGDLTITSGGGDISFDNENLSTTGTLASGALTVTGAASTTGNIHLHTNNTFFTGDSTGGGPWNLVGIDGSNDIIIGETSGALNTKIYGGQFSFVDTSATRMTISGAGSVGIGTVSSATSGNTLKVYRDLASGSTDADMVYFHQDNASDNTIALQVQQDSSSRAMYVNHQVAAPTDYLARFYAAYSSTGGAAVVDITQDHASGNAAGLMIHQDGTGKNIVFKNAAVAHGMTDTFGSDGTDTLGWINTQDPSAGGLEVLGVTEGTRGLLLRGIHVTDNTTKDGNADAAILMNTSLKSSTNITSLGTNANILAIMNNGATRFIFDVEGDGHADSAWTTYDKYDDIAIINDMEAELLAHEDEAKTERRHALEELGVIGKGSWHMENGKPRAMVNYTRLAMLHHGALIQIGQAHEDLKTRLASAENKLAQLTA